MAGLLAVQQPFFVLTQQKLKGQPLSISLAQTIPPPTRPTPIPARPRPARHSNPTPPQNRWGEAGGQ